MANVYQSADLMRFIRYLQVDIDGEVVTNVIDDSANFISRFYTPHFRVNKVSSSVLTLISDSNITEVNRQLSKSSLTAKFLNSGLKLTAPYIYQLAQIVILESFAIIYAIEEKPEMLKFINEADIQETRESVLYLVDYLGEKKEFIDIITDLHSLDVALGYIQKQIPLMQGGLAVNGTI